MLSLLYHLLSGYIFLLGLEPNDNSNKIFWQNDAFDNLYIFIHLNSTLMIQSVNLQFS